MNKINLFLQKKNVVEIPEFIDSFPKCGVILRKKGLIPERKIIVRTCFNESTPNIIFFSDETKKMVSLTIDTLTEKEAKLLVDIIRKKST